jgi:hypothetical protein
VSAFASASGRPQLDLGGNGMRLVAYFVLGIILAICLLAAIIIFDATAFH